MSTKNKVANHINSTPAEIYSNYTSLGYHQQVYYRGGCYKDQHYEVEGLYHEGCCDPEQAKKYIVLEKKVGAFRFMLKTKDPVQLPIKTPFTIEVYDYDDEHMNKVFICIEASDFKSLVNLEKMLMNYTSIQNIQDDKDQATFEYFKNIIYID